MQAVWNDIVIAENDDTHYPTPRHKGRVPFWRGVEVTDKGGKGR